MNVHGKAIKYGDNVDTDVIIPARYLNTTDKKELAAHCMEDLDSTYIDRVKNYKIMVAGNNFGCGSSREHAPVAIKESGIDLIVAKSFARIFYRNSINIGLPIIESVEAASDIEENDLIEVDFDKGEIKNITKNKIYKTEAFPKFVQSIISAGGLLNAIEGGVIK
jgi:3-isopropylmalate/(R)-2-methylmalate dehydratase small subunit